jgi:hypothetical protein
MESEKHTEDVALPGAGDKRQTLSPYCPESFDGIVKNKLPGKLFFFDPSEVPL